MRIWGNKATGADSAVAGERGPTLVYRERSLQSRLGSVLAAGLMLALGVGTLAWYYSNVLMRAERTRSSVQKTATVRSQGDVALPPLGRVDPPSSEVMNAPPAVEGVGSQAARPADAVSGSVARLQAAPLSPYRGPGSRAAGEELSGVEPRAANGGSDSGPTSRRLTEHLFARGSDIPTSEPVSGRSASEPEHGTAAGADSSVMARPHVLPTRRFLLPRGAFVDCTLETAIDSTLPGMTTCVTATDTFGADGDVVLLEKGTKLIGETRGQVQQGAARVYVIWNEARTPTGVAVPLESPGSDALGRAGVTGAVNRHFWDRFAAAILVTTIDGAVQAAVQRGDRGGGTVVYNPMPAQDVATEALKSTLAIPPTVVVPQGSRIQVLVAHDIDFRSVYELHVVAPGH